MKWQITYNNDTYDNYNCNIEKLLQDCVQNSLSQFSKQEKDFLETIHSWNNYELSEESDLNPNNFDRYAKQNSSRYYEVLQNYIIGYHHGDTDEILRKCYTNYDELFSGNDPYNKVLEIVADKFNELNKKFYDNLNFDDFIENLKDEFKQDKNINTRKHK